MSQGQTTKRRYECIIPHESVTEDMIDSTEREPWVQVVDIIQSDPEEGISQQVFFRTLDGQTLVRHLIDGRTGYPLLIVESESSITETIQKIHSLFPTYSREDIFRMLREPVDFEEYAKGVFYLGCLGLGKRCDVEILELFRQIFQQPDPNVRLDGLDAMAYAAWPEFQDLVQPLAETDPDEDVRQSAARFLEGLKQNPMTDLVNYPS